MTLPATLALVAAGLALTACGDDSSSPGSAVSSPGAEGSTITVGLRDFAFDGLPASITAGTPIAAANTSTEEAHELTAFRLPDGEARSVAELAALPPEELGALLPGAPVLALASLPGKAAELVLGSGSIVEPGRYLIVCFVPQGAEPSEVVAAIRTAAANPDAGPPQIAGGPPHLALGMVTDLEVAP